MSEPASRPGSSGCSRWEHPAGVRRSATTKHAPVLLPITVDWTEKYRPPTFFEVRGNDKARDVLAEWTEMWDDHRETAVVHGSPDVGETLTAHALVVGMGWETVELNTSDQRAGDVIERFAGRAAKNATLAGFSAGMSAR